MEFTYHTRTSIEIEKEDNDSDYEWEIVQAGIEFIKSILKRINEVSNPT